MMSATLGAIFGFAGDVRFGGVVAFAGGAAFAGFAAFRAVAGVFAPFVAVWVVVTFSTKMTAAISIGASVINM